MTAEIISILTTFAPQLTRPTWKNIKTLFIGAVPCRRARRVTSILRVMGLANEKAARQHKTSIDWTRQMVKLVSRWLNRRAWILLGDGAYACMDLAMVYIKQDVILISRLRLDAQLFESPEVKPKRRGRPYVKGKRIDLKTLVDDLTQPWQSITVNWYGGEQKTLECLSFTCLWYHAGKPPLPLRIVLVKTPDGKNKAEVFFSTDLKNTPAQIISWFVLRWNIEVTFAETRMHLGVETQRQWSDNAIQRCTPLLMAMYSILTLVAIKMNEAKTMLVRETRSWYDKNGELTFADIIVAVRRSI